MQKLLNYLKNHSVLAYIKINSASEILEFSANLNKYLGLNNNIISDFRSIIWIEDIAKMEAFISNLIKNGYASGELEMNAISDKYQKMHFEGFTDEENPDEFIVYVGNTENEIFSDNLVTVCKDDFQLNFAKVFNGLYFEFDENLQVLEILGSSLDFLGVNEDLLFNKSYSINNFLSDEDLEKFKFLHNYQNISKNLTKNIFLFQKKDGTKFWVQELLQLIDQKDKKTILALFFNIDSYKRELDQIRESKKQILELTNHLELTRENERKDMAREIHDEIGHALTSLKLDINLLVKKKFLRDDKLVERLNEMQKHIEDTIRMLQRISAQLRPSILDHFGLIAALEWQAREFQRQTSVRCKYSLPDEDLELTENKTVAVFRIFQEILTNITRHSQASRVDVILTVESNILDLKVSDNGIGIKKEDLDNPKSLGLLGMKERANLVEGNLTINSILNIGTTVHLIMPTI
ncbi:MAG: hypothetical protein A2X64_04260 [Ignavibacteria bacterium GWF2_33_9]|nr:MAG: hypothetical protein A2X64_04260 [Ignavibacteria bacterium GWF2_33_9]